MKFKFSLFALLFCPLVLALAQAPRAGLPLSLGTDSIALHPDGRIPLGGSFTSVTAVSRRGLARLHGEVPPMVTPTTQVAVWWADTNAVDFSDMPADLTNIVAIAAGWPQALALNADGRVVA